MGDREHRASEPRGGLRRVADEQLDGIAGGAVITWVDENGNETSGEVGNARKYEPLNPNRPSSIELHRTTTPASSKQIHQASEEGTEYTVDYRLPSGYTPGQS